MAESFMFLEKTPKEMLQTFLVPLTTLLTLVYLEKGYILTTRVPAKDVDDWVYF